MRKRVYFYRCLIGVQELQREVYQLANSRGLDKPDIRCYGEVNHHLHQAITETAIILNNLFYPRNQKD